jgi:hypothetical protein
VKKHPNKLPQDKIKALLLKNAKKLMSESCRTEKPELIGEKKKQQ